MVRERRHPDLDPLAVAAVVPLGPGRQYGRDSGQRLETLCGTICRLISFIWCVANGPGIRNTYIILFCPDYFPQVRSGAGSEAGKIGEGSD